MASGSARQQDSLLVGLAGNGASVWLPLAYFAFAKDDDQDEADGWSSRATGLPSRAHDRGQPASDPARSSVDPRRNLSGLCPWRVIRTGGPGQPEWPQPSRKRWGGERPRTTPRKPATGAALSQPAADRVGRFQYGTGPQRLASQASRSSAPLKSSNASARASS